MAKSASTKTVRATTAKFAHTLNAVPVQIDIEVEADDLDTTPQFTVASVNRKDIEVLWHNFRPGDSASVTVTARSVALPAVAVATPQEPQLVFFDFGTSSATLTG